METRHKLWAPVVTYTFVSKVKCILFLNVCFNLCCTLYFRPSVKSETYSCKSYNSGTHMGSSYLAWHCTACAGNYCHDAIKKLFDDKLIQDEKENSDWFHQRSEFYIMDRWDVWTTHELVLMNGSFKNIARLKILLTLLSRKRPGNISKCLTILRAFTVSGLWCGLNLNTSLCNYVMANSSKLKRRSLIGSGVIRILQYGPLS